VTRPAADGIADNALALARIPAMFRHGRATAPVFFSGVRPAEPIMDKRPILGVLEDVSN